MGNDGEKSFWMAVSTSIPAPVPRLEVALVCYGSQYVSQQAFKQWLAHNDWMLACIVNNQKNAVQAGEIAGSNTDFEFSGYAEAIPHFTSEGPFLLINDTFFHNHLSWGWTKVVHQLTQACGQAAAGQLTGVWGDIRSEQVAFPEKDKVFLASWFFFIPNRAALAAFKQCLHTLLSTPLAPPGAAYATYVEDWLQAGSIWGGWHGKIDEKALLRKRRVIRLEHRLSQLLTKETVLHGVDERIRWFPLLRLLERLHTRWLALTNEKRLATDG